MILEGVSVLNKEEFKFKVCEYLGSKMNGEEYRHQETFFAVQGHITNFLFGCYRDKVIPTWKFELPDLDKWVTSRFTSHCVYYANSKMMIDIAVLADDLYRDTVVRKISMTDPLFSGAPPAASFKTTRLKALKELIPPKNYRRPASFKESKEELQKRILREAEVQMQKEEELLRAAIKREMQRQLGRQDLRAKLTAEVKAEIEKEMAEEKEFEELEYKRVIDLD